MGNINIFNKTYVDKDLSLLVLKMYQKYRLVVDNNYDILEYHNLCMNSTNINEVLNKELSELNLTINNSSFNSVLSGITGMVFPIIQFHTNLSFKEISDRIPFHFVYQLTYDILMRSNDVYVDKIAFNALKWYDLKLHLPYLYFGMNSTYGYFSNWYPCSFYEKGIHFDSTEKYMMYHKALTFNDYDTAEKILRCTNPRDCKLLGKQLRGFSQGVWDKVKYNIVSLGNLYKFTSTPEFKDKLISTADRYIVECSPTDRTWGIGMSLEDDDCYYPNRWKGDNLLGSVLMDVRDLIIQHNL